MVRIQITWRYSSSPEVPEMQNFPADNLPSLSATSPTNDLPEKPINGFHDATKPFPTTDALTKSTKRSSTNKTNEAAVRAAKQEILSKLREDWEWPRPQTQTEDTQPPLPSPESWRERDSDSSYAPPSPPLDPYKFDTPDDLSQPLLSKKRKRQEMLEEEMKWNEGLRTYIQRRDAWAGARAEPPPPLPVTAHNYPLYNTSTNPPNNTTPNSPTLPSHTIPPTTLLPIVPPLLPPTNPIRSTITPSTYPQIYSKIILQGLSPSIPINLSDVVSALVQGWKKDGEWPPKTTEGEKNGNENGIGNGNGNGVNGGGDGGGGGRKAVRRSVGRMKKVLGLGLGIDGPGRGEGRVEE